MSGIILGLLILCLIFIGISYGNLIKKYRRLIATDSRKVFLVLFKKEHSAQGQGLLQDIISVEGESAIVEKNAFSMFFENGNAVYWFEDQIPLLGNYDDMEGELIIMADKALGIEVVEKLNLVNKMAKFCFW